MQKEELKKKIEKFLDEGPFLDGEIKMWQKKIIKMDGNKLEELFSLLQEKKKIISNANQLFIDIAEEINEKQKENLSKMPKEIVLNNLSIEDVAEIFNKELAKLLRDKEYNIFDRLDNYFKESWVLKRNTVEDFNSLIKALNSNGETLIKTNKEIGRISIGKWLNYYNQYNDSKQRKSIDRIGFANKDERAKKLSADERKILLRLVKLYDYLLNPEEFNARAEEGVIKKARTVSGPPEEKKEEEDEIAELKKMAEEYPEGSLERRVVEEEIEELTESEGVEAKGDSELEELKRMVEQYPHGSLERKVINEEINKLTINK